MIDAVAAEWLKLWSLRSNRYLLLASLLSVLLSAGIAAMVTAGFDNQSGDALLRFDSLGDGLGAGLPVACFVMAALGALSVTAEHATGLIRTSLVAVPRRWLFLVAKIPPLVAVASGAGLVLVYGMHLAAQAVLGDRAGQVLHDGRTLGVSLDEPGTGAGLLVAGAALPLAALVGLGLGALIRSAAGTLVALVVLLFVLPAGAQVLPRPLGAQAGSFLFVNLPGQIAGAGGPGILSPMAASALLVAYPVAALSLGAAALAVRGKGRTPLVAGGIATAVLVATAVVPGGAAASALAWRPCGGELECASVRVPLDWSAPEGRKLTLKIGRLPATGTHRRIGTLFAVPGGPGGSGVQDLEQRAASFASLRSRFDVVSVDPRNTIRKQDRCLIGGPVLTLPADQAAYERQAATITRAAQRCRAADPELFDHQDSASVARDIEVVRAALGEERLSVLATSYGGVPGITYARMLPGRVRAMVFDGAADHLAGRETGLRLEAAAIEGQFARFTAWCASSDDCALRGRDPGRVWRALTAAADRAPVPVKGTDVAYSGFDLKVAAAPDLISPGTAPAHPNWQRFARAVDQAVAGDAAGFASYVRTATGSPKVPSFTGMNRTHCPDGLGFRDFADYRRAKALGERLSPNFAGNELWHPLACAGWPSPVSNPPPSGLPPSGLPSMVGVGSWVDHDRTAGIVARVPGSATVRLDGPGHGLYLSGNQCVIAHVNRYLTTGVPTAATCHPPG
ncbi:alpha/beta hydrolase [Nonomuraea sp. NBC_01738]|uniref:alpha/beta fold hydrolase n=1 Tax=Nonomuraea sp. NBC_01738 TaxID=2976003 RepID=UPI002E1155A3|nr:alpha/beta hydrolase [Nonomuraea sp. NBC_01738]